MKTDTNKEMDLRLLFKLIRLMGPYKVWMILALAGLAAAAGGTLALPLLLRGAVDGPLSAGATDQGWEQLRLYGLLYLGVLLGTMVAGFSQIYLLAKVSQGVMKDLRIRLFSHFLRQPLSWMQSQPSGKLVSGVMGDVSAISDFFNTLFTSLLKDLGVMAGVVAALFALNPTLALWTTATLLPAAALLTFFRMKSRKAFRRSRSASARLGSFLSEYLGGMGLVQLFGREPLVREKFEGENRELLDSHLGELYVNAFFRPLIDLLASLSLGVLLWTGMGMVTQETLSLGVLIAFVSLLNQFYQPLGSLADNFSQLQSALAGSERVFGYLEEDHSLQETGKAELDHSEAGLSSRAWEVEFRDVHFAYQPGEPVLRGLSFRIPPGQTLALVGYTGAGKSTVTNLLTRFWSPQKGAVLLQGRDIREYRLDSLRTGVQTVLQDVVLFSGTIRENLTLGRDIPQPLLDRAAESTGMLDFIRSLPQGWETVLGEGALNLSAGQRQLLSFARVLLMDPQVILLDEATAHIDTVAEKKIQEAMEILLKGRTSLVIAHRLSTIRHAHRIVVLDQGICAEEGTHDQLMARKGLYYNLCRLQYDKEDEGTDTGND